MAWKTDDHCKQVPPVNPAHHSSFSSPVSISPHSHQQPCTLIALLYCKSPRTWNSQQPHWRETFLTAALSFATAPSLQLHKGRIQRAAGTNFPRLRLSSTRMHLGALRVSVPPPCTLPSLCRRGTGSEQPETPELHSYRQQSSCICRAAVKERESTLSLLLQRQGGRATA